VVEPVTWHPTADRATPQALIVEQDRTVVPLSAWVADAAVEATATGRVLQVLTPGYSRLTYPLEVLLRDVAGQWVVREGRERFRDGITGFRLRWSGLRFVTDLDAAPPAGTEPQPGSGDLEVQISTLHPAGASVELGASTETAIRALTGRAPAGWGIAEPVTQPWSPRELTAQCRERAPAPTQLVVVGAGVIGQLRVARVDTGVLERIQLSGPPAAVVGQDAIEELVAAVAGTARSMIVVAHTPVPPRRLRSACWVQEPGRPAGAVLTAAGGLPMNCSPPCSSTSASPTRRGSHCCWVSFARMRLMNSAASAEVISAWSSSLCPRSYFLK
jgi:hypothetical protein